MATITIPLENGGQSIRLPRVCIVCGKAECRMKKTVFQARFSGGFLGRSGTRFLYTTAPLCNAHWDHFDSYQRTSIYIWLGIFAALLLAVLSAALFQSFLFVPIAVLLAVGGAIGFFIYNSIAMRTLVHATSITEDEITLANVHRKFAVAANNLDKEWEDDFEDEDEEERERERERPRKRRPRGRSNEEEDEDWGFDDKEKQRQGKTLMYWILGIAAVAAVLMCVIGLGLFAILMLANRVQPLPGPIGQPPPGQPAPPAPPPAVALGKVVQGEPQPLPLDVGLNENTLERIYLSQLPEQGAEVGHGSFGKQGRLGFDHKQVPKEKNLIRFNGKESPHGLSLHAKSGGLARVSYRLDGNYKLLIGTAAMADLPKDAWQQTQSAITFHVVGDGRLLWSSRPMQRQGDQQPFRLGVNNVKELLLCVRCPGKASYAWAVWLDPHLLK